MKKRYDTQFYFYFLDNKEIAQRLIGSEGEVSKLAWRTPAEFLDDYYARKMKLLPPQWIITSFLSHHPHFNQLRHEVCPKIDKSPVSVHPNIP